MVEKENTVVLTELITQHARYQRQQFEPPQGLRPGPQLDQQPRNQLVQTEESHQTAVLTEDVDLTAAKTELQILTAVLMEEAEHTVVPTELITPIVALIMEKENTAVLTERITQLALYQRPQFEPPQGLRPDLQHAQQPQNQSTFLLHHQLALTEAFHQTAVLTEDVDSIVAKTGPTTQTVVQIMAKANTVVLTELITPIVS